MNIFWIFVNALVMLFLGAFLLIIGWFECKDNYRKRNFIRAGFYGLGTLAGGAGTALAGVTLVCVAVGITRSFLGI